MRGVKKLFGRESTLRLIVANALLLAVKDGDARIRIDGMGSLKAANAAEGRKPATVDDSSSPFRNARGILVEGILDFDSGFLKSELNIGWGIDPFEKVPGYVFKMPTATLPKLQGVFFDGEASSALLDGEEYEVGDETPSGYTVAEIGRNYVLVEKEQSLLEIVIPPAVHRASIIDVREHVRRTR